MTDQGPAPPTGLRHSPQTAHRERLVGGLLAAIEEKGYAEITVVDIVRHAHVSKRTFYEHFSDKDATLRALYSLAIHTVQNSIRVAASRPGPWQVRAHAAFLTFAQTLARYPGLARTILVDIAATGPLSLQARDDAHRGFDDIMRQAVEDARADNPDLKPLSADLATALTGAVFEHLVRQLHSGAINPDHIASVGTELLALVIQPASHH